jgi:divalent metal cation (Fe/Co/Zn/Cd) transporter
MGLGISLLVIWGGWQMARQAVEDLMDGFSDQEFLGKVRAVTGLVPGVRGIQVLKARRMGPFVLVDTEIGVSGELTVEAGHRVAEEVRQRVRSEVSGVADCMVHVNPVEETEERAE